MLNVLVFEVLEYGEVTIPKLGILYACHLEQHPDEMHFCVFKINQNKIITQNEFFYGKIYKINNKNYRNKYSFKANYNIYNELMMLFKKFFNNDLTFFELNITCSLSIDILYNYISLSTLL